MEDCRKKRDWVGLSRACYSLGKAAMDQGNLNQAVLWLHRADTIYSADDQVYEELSSLADDCSDRIGALEEAPLLYNSVPAEVEEKAEELNSTQIRVWGLLSMARLVQLGNRLGALPGCEALAKLDWAVDIMLKSFQSPITQEEFSQLFDLCNDLYELGDSESFYAGGEIPASGGAPFQVFDLNGMSVLLELNCYLDNHLRFLSALSQGQEVPDPETGILSCTLMLDYHVRTGADRLEEVPQLQAELARIWSDCDFVCSGLTWSQAAQKIAEYKALDILGSR